MSRKYNNIYSKLVEDETDIVGHIAYALYKSDKIKYIENSKAKNNGAELSEDDLVPFHDISSMDESIERYKIQALQILQRFLDNVLKESAEDIKEEYIRSHNEHIEKIVKKYSQKWWQNVIWSVLAAFVFALIVAAFAFINSYQ